MLRIGVVGLGTRGRTFTYILKNYPGVEVVAGADPVEATRAKAQQETGLEKLYTDYREMYSAEKLDAVIVATPDHLHTQAAVDAAKAGLHLMIEKPLATTVADAAAIRNAVKENKVNCFVAFGNRWNIAFASLKQQIAEGQFGDILLQSVRLSNVKGVAGKLNWNPPSSPGWFLMAHTVDLGLWLSGKKPVRVYGAGFKKELVSMGYDTWDSLQGTVTFDDGTSAVFESSWVLPNSFPSGIDFKYHIVGSKGAANLDQTDQGVHLALERYTYPGTTHARFDGQVHGFTAWMAQSFARQLIDGNFVGPTVDEGYTVTRVVEAVHESARTGKVIELG
jgi:predicted dehydrogenase